MPPAAGSRFGTATDRALAEVAADLQDKDLETASTAQRARRRPSQRSTVTGSEAPEDDELPPVEHCIEGLLAAADHEERYLWLQDLLEHAEEEAGEGRREVRAALFGPASPAASDAEGGTALFGACQRIFVTKHAVVREAVLLLIRCALHGVPAASDAAARRQVAATELVIEGLRDPNARIVAAAAGVAAQLCAPCASHPGLDAEIAERLTAEGGYERILTALPGVCLRGSSSALENLLVGAAALARLQAGNVRALSVRRSLIRALLALPQQAQEGTAVAASSEAAAAAAGMLRLVALGSETQSVLAGALSDLISYCDPCWGAVHPSDSIRVSATLCATAALLRQKHTPTDAGDLRCHPSLPAILRRHLQPQERPDILGPCTDAVRLLLLPETPHSARSANLDAFGEQCCAVLCEQLLQMAYAAAQGGLSPGVARDALHALRVLAKRTDALRPALVPPLLPLGAIADLLRRYPLSGADRDSALLARSVAMLLVRDADQRMGLRALGVEPDPARDAAAGAATEAERRWVLGQEDDVASALAATRAVRQIQRRWRGIAARRHVGEMRAGKDYLLQRSAQLLRELDGLRREVFLSETTERADREEDFARGWHRIASGAKTAEFARSRVVKEAHARRLLERQALVAEHEQQQQEMVAEETAHIAELARVQAAELGALDAALGDAELLDPSERDAHRAELRAQRERAVRAHAQQRLALRRDLAARRDRASHAAQVALAVLAERQDKAHPMLELEVDEEQHRGYGAAGRECWWGGLGVARAEEAARAAIQAAGGLQRAPHAEQAVREEIAGQELRARAATTDECHNTAFELGVAELGRFEATGRAAVQEEWSSHTATKVLPGYDYLRRWLIACRQVSDWMERKQAEGVEEVRRLVLSEWQGRDEVHLHADRTIYALRIAAHFRAATHVLPRMEAAARRALRAAESDAAERLELMLEEEVTRGALREAARVAACTAVARTVAALMRTEELPLRSRIEAHEERQRAALRAAAERALRAREVLAEAAARGHPEQVQRRLGIAALIRSRPAWDSLAALIGLPGPPPEWAFGRSPEQVAQLLHSAATTALPATPPPLPSGRRDPPLLAPPVFLPLLLRRAARGLSARPFLRLLRTHCCPGAEALGLDEEPEPCRSGAAALPPPTAPGQRSGGQLPAAASPPAPPPPMPDFDGWPAAPRLTTPPEERQPPGARPGSPIRLLQRAVGAAGPRLRLLRVSLLRPPPAVAPPSEGAAPQPREAPADGAPAAENDPGSPQQVCASPSQRLADLRAAAAAEADGTPEQQPGTPTPAGAAEVAALAAAPAAGVAVSAAAAAGLLVPQRGSPQRHGSRSSARRTAGRASPVEKAPPPDPAAATEAARAAQRRAAARARARREREVREPGIATDIKPGGTERFDFLIALLRCGRREQSSAGLRMLVRTAALELQTAIATHRRRRASQRSRRQPAQGAAPPPARRAPPAEDAACPAEAAGAPRLCTHPRAPGSADSPPPGRGRQGKGQGGPGATPAEAERQQRLRAVAERLQRRACLGGEGEGRDRVARAERRERAALRSLAADAHDEVWTRHWQQLADASTEPAGRTCGGDSRIPSAPTQQSPGPEHTLWSGDSSAPPPSAARGQPRRPLLSPSPLKQRNGGRTPSRRSGEGSPATHPGEGFASPVSALELLQAPGASPRPDGATPPPQGRMQLPAPIRAPQPRREQRGGAASGNGPPGRHMLRSHDAAVWSAESPPRREPAAADSAAPPPWQHAALAAAQALAALPPLPLPPPLAVKPAPQLPPLSRVGAHHQQQAPPRGTRGNIVGRFAAAAADPRRPDLQSLVQGEPQALRRAQRREEALAQYRQGAALDGHPDLAGPLDPAALLQPEVGAAVAEAADPGAWSSVMQGALRTQARQQQLLAIARAQRDITQLNYERQLLEERRRMREHYLMGADRQCYVHDLRDAPAFDPTPDSPVPAWKLRRHRRDIV